MRLFCMGMMLMMLPLMLAGNRIELRVDSPVQFSAAISGDIAEEVIKDLKEAEEEIRHNLGVKTPPPPMPPMPGAIINPPQEGFVPDVYPSQRAAIRAAAAQWIKQVILSSKEMPTSVHVVTSGRTPGEASQELRNAVQSQLPAARYEVHLMGVNAPPIEQASPGTVWAQFEIEGHSNSGGAVILKGNVPILPAVEMRFVSKPWADDFAEFANGRPDKKWVIGKSLRTCTTPMEATEDALRHAADSVAGLLRQRLQAHAYHAGLDEAWLMSRLQGEMERQGLIKDRFVQRYERPYGTIWREAVLVDASPSTIEYLVANTLDALRVRHATWRNTAVSVAGLLVVIYLLYLLVNAVTKGYFVWRLRTAAVVLAAVGAVMLMWFIAEPAQQLERRMEHYNSSVQPAAPAAPEYRLEY